MPTVRRNIYAYKVFTEDSTGGQISPNEFNLMFQSINSLDINDRVMDKGDNGFIFLDEYNILEGNMGFGWYKSARIGERPPVISRSSLAERDNPRYIDEGDCLKTHFLYRPADGLLLLEYVHVAVARLGAIRNYLYRNIVNNHRHRHLQQFNIEPLLSRGFLNRINEFSRISFARIKVSTVQPAPNDYGALPAALHTSLQEARASYYNLEVRAGRENQRTGLSLQVIGDFISQFLGRDTVNPTFLNGILLGNKPDGQQHRLELKGCEERQQVSVDTDELGQVVTMSIRGRMTTMTNSIPLLR